MLRFVPNPFPNLPSNEDWDNLDGDLRELKPPPSSREGPTYFNGEMKIERHLKRRIIEFLGEESVFHVIEHTALGECAVILLSLSSPVCYLAGMQVEAEVCGNG